MKFNIQSRTGVQILELEGRFDAFETPQVKAWIEAHVGVNANRLVINLRGVNFIDSVGLAALVSGMKRCRGTRGDLYLCCLSQSAQTIFALTRLDQAFHIFESDTDAVAAFRPSA